MSDPREALCLDEFRLLKSRVIAMERLGYHKAVTALLERELALFEKGKAKTTDECIEADGIEERIAEARRAWDMTRCELESWRWSVVTAREREKARAHNTKTV